MRLKVWIPTEVLLDEEVTKVKAEAENGWFCILPRHIDFVTALVPGILSFESPGNPTQYLAIDHGILVKCGSEVAVSTRNAVRGSDLASLQETVAKQFRALREKGQTARMFEAKLEAELVRQLVRRRSMPEKLGRREENLVREVGVRQARMRRRQKQGSSGFWANFWQAASLVGSIGWVIALPPLIGIAVGAWIDHRWPSRFSWTLMLMFAGLVLGYADAWNRINREQRRP